MTKFIAGGFAAPVALKSPGKEEGNDKGKVGNHTHT